MGRVKICIIEWIVRMKTERVLGCIGTESQSKQNQERD